VVTRATILKKKYATEAELDVIDEKIEEVVKASVEFAENSPIPDESELYTDVYLQEDYPFIMD
jgi:pyruvate dehydrogenase E1 component alpha subunit